HRLCRRGPARNAVPSRADAGDRASSRERVRRGPFEQWSRHSPHAGGDFAAAEHHRRTELDRAARSEVVSLSRLFALLVLALAFVLRAWDLAGRSLWLDEAVEYWTATSPVLHLPSYVRDIIQDPPLFSFLLHVWMTPSHELVWMRLLTVLFGVGSVAGVMVVGYRLQGRAAALGAGVLMAVMPPSIFYAQELGQYARMKCLITW